MNFAGRLGDADRRLSLLERNRAEVDARDAQVMRSSIMRQMSAMKTRIGVRSVAQAVADEKGAREAHAATVDRLRSVVESGAPDALIERRLRMVELHHRGHGWALGAMDAAVVREATSWLDAPESADVTDG